MDFSKAGQVWWPEVDTLDKAKAASYQGVGAAIVIAGITAVVTTYELLTGRPILKTGYIDVIIMAIVGWRVYKVSPAWSIIGLAVTVLEKGYMYWETGGQNNAHLFFGLLFAVMFLNSFRGAVAYKKLQKEVLEQVQDSSLEEVVSEGCQASPKQSKRPKLVWVIFIVYILLVISSIFSLAVTYSILGELTQDQVEFLTKNVAVDLLLCLIIGGLNAAGAALLFMMRRWAYDCFLFGLIVSLLSSVYYSVFTNWTSVFGGNALVGLIVGCLISGAVLLYARNLARAGRLR